MPRGRPIHDRLATLPAILVIAWVASRLLGVRRSVTATVLSGALGWLAAIMFALVITDIPFRQASRSEEFSNNVWLFSVVFTMLATAGLQLLPSREHLRGYRAALSRSLADSRAAPEVPASPIRSRLCAITSPYVSVSAIEEHRNEKSR